MYLSKSKCWYSSNNCLHFLKRTVPFQIVFKLNIGTVLQYLPGSNTLAYQTTA